MIYTVTLNPALDYVIQVDHFQAGRINRNITENIYYGGKGINVSCILHELQAETTALGFIAGFTGRALQDGLQQMGIKTDFIEAESGMTRINVKMKSDEETEINGIGPKITESDFSRLLEKIRQLHDGDTLVLSGSIPAALQNDTYERILSVCDPQVQIAADAEKELLLNVLKYKPFLIKPNSIELGQMFNTVMKDSDDIIMHARLLQAQGARNVLISMAKDGAILVSEEGDVYQIGVAEGKLVSSVGAGDSMVAGFLAGYQKTRDYTYALKLGTACGGATAFRSGLATREQIGKVFNTL